MRGILVARVTDPMNDKWFSDCMQETTEKNRVLTFPIWPAIVLAQRPVMTA